MLLTIIKSVDGRKRKLKKTDTVFDIVSKKKF